jgi:cell division protein FtsB
MGFFEFVFSTTFLVFGFVLLLQVLKNRAARRQHWQDDGAASELQALRARVEALEAIVTDRRTQLAQEIDSLEREPRRAQR